MNRKRMRSPLGRALELGSAKDGVKQWWLERVTAIALVPLTVWFAASIVVHTGNDYFQIVLLVVSRQIGFNLLFGGF